MHKHKKIISVTVGIPAYNEEQNIGRLLREIVKQSEKNIKINEVIILSDGSTDETVAIARSVKDKRVKVFAGSNRKGKCFRLRQLFKMAKSEVLVLLDADVLPTSKATVSNLCMHFLSGKEIALIGGVEYGLPPSTFTEKALNNLNEAFNMIREGLNNGHNVFCVRGGILAISRNYFKNIDLPLNMIPDDNFFYLLAKRRNLIFHYEKDAAVWYRNPQTVADQISQGCRFLASKELLRKYFGAANVDREFRIPLVWRLKVLFYQLKKNSFAYIWLKFIALRINILIRNKDEAQKSTVKLWNRVKSSKTLHMGTML